MWSGNLSFKFLLTQAKPEFQAIAHLNLSVSSWFPQTSSSLFQTLCSGRGSFHLSVAWTLSRYSLLSLRRHCTVHLPLVLSPLLDCRPFAGRTVLRPFSSSEKVACHGSQLRLEGCSVIKLESGWKWVPTRFPEPWLSDWLNYSLKVNK